MSNSMEHENNVDFHPGYYIADVIADMGISREEFAARMGITVKTISDLVNGQCSITKDLAERIAIMIGTSPEVWLNLQRTYDQKCMENDSLCS